VLVRTLKRYKISIIKEYKERGVQADEFLRYGNTFVGVCYFKDENFDSLSDSVKRKRVRRILSNIQRYKVSSKYRLKEKERVIVNEQGRYGLDKTLFDSEVRMPKHLVDKKKGRVGGMRG
jgi:hypothetical protein